MIPQTAEYALRAVVCLAGSAGRPQTSDQIAAVTRVPPRYLYKVLQTLVRAQLVRSQPGPQGGYSLNCKPAEITILDVINVVEPIRRIRSCPLGFEHSDADLCPLHRELDAAFASIERAFSRVTIAALVRRRTTGTPLCETKP